MTGSNHGLVWPILPVLPILSGLLFGFGLIVSGMTDPSLVLAFLDATGHWNPALAFVMGGAVMVTLPAFTYVRRRGRSLSGETVTLPNRTLISPRLVYGSTVFGIGWGLSGVCPGPSLVIATGGTDAALLFLAAMLAGMAIYAGLDRWRYSQRITSAVDQTTSA